MISEERLHVMSALMVSAYAAYASSLVSGPPISLTRFEWFRKISPGDLVMEISSLFHRSYDEYRIGYLVSDQMEPYGTDDWWEENKEDYEGQRPQERVFTIKRLFGGTNFRWTNAMMIRVPERIGDFP